MKMHFNFTYSCCSCLHEWVPWAVQGVGMFCGVFFGGGFFFFNPSSALTWVKGLQDLSPHGVVLVGRLWTLHLGPKTKHLGVCTFCSFEVHVQWEGVSINSLKSQEAEMFRCLSGLWEDLCHGSNNGIWYVKFFQLHHFIFLFPDVPNLHCWSHVLRQIKGLPCCSEATFFLCPKDRITVRLALAETPLCHATSCADWHYPL